MIQINNKSNCTGCTACENACPENCIIMKEDNEGFLYPVINIETCTNCGLCEKTCPVINKKNLDKIPRAFVAQNKNDETRRLSSSGGVFSALAEHVLSLDGVVYGVGYNNSLEVIHKFVRKQDEKDYKEFRGSKYVQSKLGNSFHSIKEFLDTGRLVLFSGTPCQVAGLKSYLRSEYENLILIDIVCYGVSSPKLFKKYLNYCSGKYKSTVQSIAFRDKSYGYASPNVKMTFDNGKSVDSRSDIKSFTKVFFRGFCSRPSCYDCTFKTIGRLSDITLADCWSIKKYNQDMDDDKGTSNIFVHSDKGQKLIELIGSSLRIMEVDAGKVIDNDGVMILKSDKPNPKRKDFFEEIDSLEYGDLIKKYAPDSYRNKLANFVKPILLKTGLLKTGILKVVKKLKMKEDRKNKN